MLPELGASEVEEFAGIEILKDFELWKGSSSKFEDTCKQVSKLRIQKLETLQGSCSSRTHSPNFRTSESNFAESVSNGIAGLRV